MGHWRQASATAELCGAGAAAQKCQHFDNIKHVWEDHCTGMRAGGMLFNDQAEGPTACILELTIGTLTRPTGHSKPTSSNHLACTCSQCQYLRGISRNAERFSELLNMTEPLPRPVHPSKKPQTAPISSYIYIFLSEMQLRHYCC